MACTYAQGIARGDAIRVPVQGARRAERWVPTGAHVFACGRCGWARPRCPACDGHLPCATLLQSQWEGGVPSATQRTHGPWECSARGAWPETHC